MKMKLSDIVLKMVTYFLCSVRSMSSKKGQQQNNNSCTGADVALEFYSLLEFLGTRVENQVTTQIFTNISYFTNIYDYKQVLVVND